MKLLKELYEAIVQAMISFANAMRSTKFAIVIISLPIATFMAIKLNASFVEYTTLYLMPAIGVYTAGRIVSDKQDISAAERKREDKHE